MGSLFSPKMPSLPPVQPLPEVPTGLSDAEKKAIADEQAAIARKRKGRSSTILTGSMGLQDEANTDKKTLLGG